MNKRTLKALRGSIKKWKRIVTGYEMDQGPDNCPLCKVFQFQDEGEICGGCPVAEATGRMACEGTPYGRFIDAAYQENQMLGASLDGEPNWHHFDGKAVVGPRAQQAAINEYLFLVSLLPPGEKP